MRCGAVGDRNDGGRLGPNRNSDSDGSEKTTTVKGARGMVHTGCARRIVASGAAQARAGSDRACKFDTHGGGGKCGVYTWEESKAGWMGTHFEF